MTDDILRAWATNNRINLFLIDRINPAGMSCTLSRHGGRNVAGQFAHMHNIRVAQLEGRAPDLARDLAKFPPRTSPSKEALREALTASGAAVGEFLSQVGSGAPRRKGFKRGLATTLAYFVAHESHHRGSILLTLKQCGQKLDKASSYGIWAWDTI